MHTPELCGLPSQSSIRRGSPLTCVCSPQEAEGSLPYLLVLCGDHGMSETGSHGGSSEPEVNTPLVLISPAFKRKGKQPADKEGKQICYETEEPKWLKTD